METIRLNLLFAIIIISVEDWFMIPGKTLTFRVQSPNFSFGDKTLRIRIPATEYDY